MSNDPLLPVMHISRLRVNTDGRGIRTLVLSAKCPLECKYCMNDFCHGYPRDKIKEMTTSQLYKAVKSHRMYWWASGGGLNFGGGEPLLYEDFILEFARKYSRGINIAIETSLNVPLKYLSELKELVSLFIVDIKDMNPDIYCRYTGLDNSLVMKNLETLRPAAEKVIIRVPEIPGYNNETDKQKSVDKLKNMGFGRINFFRYVIKK